MDQNAVTLGRSVKIWWSFAWRSWVLFMLIVFPLEIISAIWMFKHMPAAGTQPDPTMMAKAFSGFAVIWPIMMALIVLLQAQGMKWMLRKAEWSDFKLELLPKDR